MLFLRLFKCHSISALILLISMHFIIVLDSDRFFVAAADLAVCLVGCYISRCCSIHFNRSFFIGNLIALFHTLHMTVGCVLLLRQLYCYCSSSAPSSSSVRSISSSSRWLSFVVVSVFILIFISRPTLMATKCCKNPTLIHFVLMFFVFLCFL